MTKRVRQPDTEADVELRACLDQRPPMSFVMIAGAGSGKTTSLVKGLAHLAKTKGPELRRRGQKIACITFTEVAVGEIWADVGSMEIFHISTIHSFLWAIIRPFQVDIRNWVMERIDAKISEANDKIGKPRTQAKTREKLAGDIERYTAQRAKIQSVPKFTYGVGSDYVNGILGHDDVLKIGPKFLSERPLLQKLVSQRFPFIFIDESQDTNPDFVFALMSASDTVGGNLCLGFFGDPMQKIYMSGAGDIVPKAGWKTIKKRENFRCPKSVLDVINKIRAEGDGLEQIRGRTVDCDGQPVSVQGTARIAIIQSDERRNERIVQLRDWLAKEDGDSSWIEDGDSVRLLVLVHRKAAAQLGFLDLFQAINGPGSSALKDGLLDGSAWAFRPFLSYLLPLASAVMRNDDFEVISLLRKHSPVLSGDEPAHQNMKTVLLSLRTDMQRLGEILGPGSDVPIKEVVTFVRDQGIATIDDRFLRYLDPAIGEEESADDQAARGFLACPAGQLWGYRTYIEDKSPFATQQGIKGAESERVIVILDDEEDNYSSFSYNKYFGIKDLSETDQSNIREGKESVIDRTRRLFYVCCSRALQDLVVAIFIPNPDVERATKAIIERGFFEETDVINKVH